MKRQENPKHFEGGHHHAVMPSLFLQFWFFTGCHKSVSYVADKLSIDVFEAEQLIQHLNSTFTIESPMHWLEDLQLQINKRHRETTEAKANLMAGRAVVNQAKDTGEERRIKQRKNHDHASQGHPHP